MKKIAAVSISICLALMLVASAAFTANRASPLIIDHTCTGYQSIPPQWIEAVKHELRLHYAHTSYGAQLTTGLGMIEQLDPFYDVNIAFGFLPSDTGALCTFDGQYNDTYITPGEYWESALGMDQTRMVLESNATINVSLWTWCSELAGYGEAEVGGYLDSLSRLEAEFPNVTFIYATGNCQWTGNAGYNTFRRNEQIREFCLANNKILYDFGDLDCWWFNPDTQQWEYSSYYYEGYGYAGQVPLQHPHFNGSEADHTTFESCEQKAKAVWFMLAMLAGWGGTTTGVEDAGTPQATYLAQNFPNPFNPATKISFGLREPAGVSLRIYDAAGRLVRVLVEGDRAAGTHAELWDGRDGGGDSVASGIYFYRLRAGTFSETRKMILIK